MPVFIPAPIQKELIGKLGMEGMERGMQAQIPEKDRCNGEEWG